MATTQSGPRSAGAEALVVNCDCAPLSAGDRDRQGALLPNERGPLDQPLPDGRGSDPPDAFTSGQLGFARSADPHLPTRSLTPTPMRRNVIHRSDDRGEDLVEGFEAHVELGLVDAKRRAEADTPVTTRQQDQTAFEGCLQDSLA